MSEARAATDLLRTPHARVRLAKVDQAISSGTWRPLDDRGRARQSTSFSRSKYVGAVKLAERLSGTWARVAVVIVVSFLSGMLAFFAQGLLPDAVSSFANSASGWTFVTVVVLAWARVRTGFAAVLGAASFVLLTLGYSVSAHLRDLAYDPALFVVVGVLVGPFVGIATSWLRAESSWHAAAGTALLSGIGLGEGSYGLTMVADTTSPVYWTLVGVIALGLLVTMLIRRIHGVLVDLLAVVGTGAIAGAFFVAYSALGGI